MRSKRTALVAAAALIAAACSNSQARPAPEIPGDVAEETTAVDTTTTSTTTTSTTSSTTTTTTTTLDPTALIVAEQFPGVNFPAATLPTEAGSINNNRAPAETDKDQALIAAFVEATNAAIEVQQSPTDSSAYAASPLTDEARANSVAAAANRAAANQVLDMAGGLTVRPYVVEREEPDVGLVYDCSINAAVWRDADTDEPAEASTGWPQVGAPGVERGVGYLFELVDGSWLLSSVFTEPGACG